MDKINSFFNIKIKLNQKLNDLQINSKDIKPYDVFIALDGSNTSGKNYIDEALSFGASLIIVNSSKALDKLIEYKNTSAVLYIHNLENILGKLCASFYDYPFRKIKVIGVTGTNGKTTTAYITSILLSRLGYKTAFLGTIGNGSPFELKPSINTTESAVHIYKNLDKFYKEGYEYVSMEVSSHGISLNRIQGIEFYSVIFTNLTHDHLNFHKTFENYEKEKFRLFTEFKSLNKIINASNEIGISWLKKLPEAISYMVNPSITRNNFITAKVLAKSMLSQELLIKLRSNSFNIKTNLIGSFNIENLLASLSCIALIEKDIVKLQNLDFTFINIPGRMELYKAENTPLYIIDYAHTPDGIDKILKTLKENLKESLESKLVVLFGFGGGRDISTRSEIVKLIFQYADKVIYTIDNPRFEPLDEIFSSAFKDVNPELLSKVQIIFNRSNAILITSKQFTLNDTIAVLGKGAEKFQEVMGVRYHYMDKEEVKKVI